MVTKEAVSYTHLDVYKRQDIVKRYDRAKKYLLEVIRVKEEQKVAMSIDGGA